MSAAQSQDRIDSLVDIPAVKEQFDQLNKFIDETRAKIISMPKMMEDYKSNASGANAKKASDDLAQANKGVKDSFDKLGTSLNDTKGKIDQVAQAQAKLASLNTQEAKDLALINEQRKQATSALAAEAKAQLAGVGSKNEARAAIASMLKEQNSLNLSTAEGRARSAELTTEIDKQNLFIKENSDALSKQKINVGNYTSATEGLSTILGTLRSEITSATTAYGANSEQVQSLTTKFDLVSGMLQKQEGGFASLTMELRNAERALVSLNEQGLKDSEGFNQLQAAVAEAKRGVNQFNQNQKLLESAAPTLTAMTVAAKGLGGAYAIGAGLGGIFGDEQGKIARETEKLIAIMTLLQGLEEVHQLLLQKDAVLMNISAGITSAFAAAKNLLAGSTTKVIEAEASQAVAVDLTTTSLETQQAVIAEAAVSLDGFTLASAETTVALEAQTGATTEAAVAAGVLDTALSVGIIGILALIATGIYFLVKALSSMGEEALKEIDATKDYVKALNDLNDALLFQNSVLDDNIKKSKDKLEADIKLAEAAGKNKVLTGGLQTDASSLSKQEALSNVLALDNKGVTISSPQADIDKALVRVKAIANEADKKRADAAKDQVRFDEEHLKLMDTKRQRGKDAVIPTSELTPETQSDNRFTSFANQGFVDVSDAIASNDKLKKSQDDLAKDANDNYNKIQGALDNYSKSVTDNAADVTKLTKEKKDEADKKNEESARNNLELIIDTNSRIIANSNSTEAQKLTAVKNTETAKNELLDSSVAKAKDDLKDQIITQDEYNTKLSDIEKDRTINIRDEEEKRATIKREYMLKDLQAQLDADKALADAQSGIYKTISGNAALSPEQRISALQQEYDIKNKILKQETAAKLIELGPGGTDVEKKSLNDQLNSQLLQSKSDYAADALKIAKSAVEQEKEIELKALDDITIKYNEAELVRQKGYIDDLDKKTDAYNNGKLTYKKYLEEKEKLDDAYATVTIANTEALIKSQLAEYKKLYPNLDASESDAKKSLSDAKTGESNSTDLGDKQKYSDQAANAQEVLDNIARVRKAEGELNKQLNDTEEKQDTQTVKNKTDRLKEWGDHVKSTLLKVQEAYSALNEAVVGMAKASAEKQINLLQDQVNANTAAKDNEVKNIQASTLSAEQKAAAIQNINAKTEADNDALKAKQQKEREKEANYEKAATIFKVTLDTIKAVTGFLAEQDYFAAIAAGVEGAAQLAVAIATPVPRYAKGTTSSAEGWAFTDELGAELYKTPSGETFMGSDNGANLKYLERGTEIISHDQVNNYKLANVAAWAGGYTPNNSSVTTDKKIEGLTHAVLSSGRENVKALKKYRSNVTVINKANYWDRLKSDL